MQKIEDYKVLSYKSPQALERGVCIAVSKGYIPQGGLVMSGHEYMQAMVKYEDKN